MHPASLLTVIASIFTFSVFAQTPKPDRADSTSEASESLTNRAAITTEAKPPHTNDPINRIREEGLNHSQVMDTLSYLTDVIGPRLTGSPSLKRANEWTREKLTSWGLTNCHLESWGPFGRGWSLERFSAQVVEPQTIPLIGHPNAWSPGLDKVLVADVVHFEAKTPADLEKFKGKLAGKIVLSGAMRELKAGFDPLASRLMETNLLRLANAGEPRAGTDSSPVRSVGSRSGSTQASDSGAVSNATRSGSEPRAQRGRRPQSRYLSFLEKEGAALIVSGSSQGEGGTFFVAAASVPTPDSQGTNSSTTNVFRSWSTNAPAIPPQITIAAEDYNRLARMLQQGEKLKMAVELRVQFHDQDPMAYNTVAEIPGSDLKDELVMLGAHMDSWHSGTGATDNAAGVAATMEAVRILSALKLQPRRTIRIGLWSGEEQGLFGSKAYVAKHLGYYTNFTSPVTIRSPKDETMRASFTRSSDTNSPSRKLVRGSEYEKVSAYFNLDNGGGKIRGIYMQGNERVRPIFRRWLAPFADLGAETLSLSNTGGTDHQSFDTIGVPGFQFIQDPMDYNTRTHHSNEDVFDRVQPDDLKQAATIIAAFVYNVAMADDKLPRKPTEGL
jgi:carboxypeptidase Q